MQWSSISIYEVDPVKLYDEYENLTGLKLCRTCFSDRVKAFNYLRKLDMAKKKKVDLDTEIVSEVQTNKYSFKPEFKGQNVHIKGLHNPINSNNLTDELAEKYFINTSLSFMINTHE